MGTRRRPGWQDELSRSFSRLFSRTSSQEKEEDSGEEQERGDRSSSRLFFRSTSQERKGGSDRTELSEEPERGQSPSRLFRRTSQETNVSGRGSREEPSGLSRLFSRTSSQEKEEDSGSPRSAGEDRSRHEDNGNLTLESQEQLSIPESEQVKQDQVTSPALQSTSESEEEKDGESTHTSKEPDSEKQPREKFLNFLGSLFHFSPKSSQGNSKQTPGVQNLSKEHEDGQVKNNLDKEDLNQEQALDVCSGIEQPADQNTAHEEDPVVSSSETVKDEVKQEQQEETSPKLNGYTLNAPAITYGTYRGSRRIRKLLKRRPDVNSPIPEKEETSEKETNCTEDADTESCCMLHQLVKMDPSSDADYESQILPTEIQIKMLSKSVDLDQIVNSREGLFEALQPSAMESSVTSLDLQPNAEISNISKDLQPSDESCSNILEDPELNCKISSNISDDLQLGTEGSANISGALETSADRGAPFSDILHTDAEESSSVSGDLHLSAMGSSSIIEDTQPKLSSIHSEDLESNAQKSSKASEDLQPNAMESSVILDVQPDVERISNISEDLQHSDESCSNILVDTEPYGKSSSNISDDLQLGTEDSANISGALETSADRGSLFSDTLHKDSEESSSVSGQLQPSDEGSASIIEDTQPKESSKHLDDLEAVAYKSPNISDDLQPNAMESSVILDVQPAVEKISNISEDLQHSDESCSNILENPELHGKSSSNISDDLQLGTEDSANISGALETSADRGSLFSDTLHKDSEESSSVSGDVQRSDEGSASIIEDTQPKESSKHLDDLEAVAYKSSNISEDLQPNAMESSVILDVQPAVEKISNISEDLQPSDDSCSNILEDSELNSKTSLNISDDLQPGAEESTDISGALETSADRGSSYSDTVHTDSEARSSVSGDLQPSAAGISIIIEDTQPMKSSKHSEDLEAIAYKSSKISEDLQPNFMESSITVDLQTNAEKNSNISENMQPGDDSCSNILEHPEPNGKIISNISDDLQTSAEENTNISGALETSVDRGSTCSATQLTDADGSSSVSGDLQASAEGSSNILEDMQPKESSKHSEDIAANAHKTSKVSEDLQPNAEDSEPNAVDSVNISEDLQTSAETSSKMPEAIHTKAEESSSVYDDLQPSAAGSSSNLESIQQKECSKISEDLQPNPEESSMILQALQPNTEESLRTSGYIQPNAEGSSKTLGKLSPNKEESSRTLENLQLNVNKSTKIINNLQPKTEQFSADLKPKTITVSCSLEGTHVDSEEGLKLSEDLEANPKENVNVPEELQSCTEDNAKYSADFWPKTIDCFNISGDPETNVEHHNMEVIQVNTDILKSEKYVFINDLQSDTDKILDRADLQPITQESTTISAVLQPNTKGSSIIMEDFQLNGDENSKHLITDLKKKESKEVQPKIETIPEVNLDVQINGNSKITENMQQNTNDMIKEHQLNAKVINSVPENPQLKTRKVPRSELQLNTNGNLTVMEDLKNNGEETSKTRENLQLNTQVNLNVSEKPQRTVGRIPRIETNQLNINVGPNISEAQNAQIEKPSKRSVDQQPTAKEKDLNSAVSVDNSEKAKNNSKITLSSVTLDKTNTFIHLAPNPSSCMSEHSLPMITDIPVHTVSESEELGRQMLTDTFDYCLVAKNKVNLDKMDGVARELNLKPITSDNADNKSQTILINDSYQNVSVVDVKPVPENSLTSISSLDKSNFSGTATNISLDNVLEFRSSSPTIILDYPSSPYDCNNVTCDSPQDAVDSGIVSSQAYTPEEHIPLKIFPPEIFSKHISDTFAVDKDANIIGDIKLSGENIESTVSLVPKPGSIAKLKSSPLLKEDKSLADSCAANSGIDISGGFSAPDNLKSNMNSEVYIAKVSVKTVNIEEVKIPPYGFLSDVISVGKVESPTFEKELICLPNLSPPPADSADSNKFQVPQSAQEDKSVTNGEMSFSREDVTANNNFNNCEKDPKKCIVGIKELPSSNKENNVSAHMVNMLKNDKKIPTSTNKSPDVLIENIKNNNLSVHTCGNIINVSLQTCPFENELRNQSLLSSDSQWKIGSCESLSESNPDLEVTHSEPGKLYDVLNHAPLQADVNLSDDLISSDSTTPKIILPDYSESANELYQQKANEIIFTVLNSAMDEFKNINKNSANIACLHSQISITPDVKLAEEKTSNNFQQSLEYSSVDVPSGVLEKSLDSILRKSKDPFMSIAEGLVNEVISSSKQLMVSNTIQKIINEDSDTNEMSPKKPPNNLNQAFVDKNDPPENITSLIKNDSLLDINNAVYMPFSERNCNAMTTTGMLQNVPSSQTTDPSSLDEFGSRATVGMRDRALNVPIESSVLAEAEDKEEHSNCFINPCVAEINNPNVQNDSSLTFDMNVQGDLEIENLKCNEDQNEYYDSEMGYSSRSLETEGSLNEFLSNHLSEEIYNMYMSEVSSEFSDPFQFFVHNSQYVEISESDDELGDEDKDYGASGQDSVEDSFLSVQSRRVRIYPFALSPIYEDDSSCEGPLSNSSSPRHIEGAAASNNENSHASILSLLQSVSDRLKEADMDEMGSEERLPFLNNEAVVVSDQPNKDTSESLSVCKTSLDVPTLPEEEKPSGGSRSSLFITKSFTENRPSSVPGRQSFLLNLSSQSNIAGAKSAAENTSVPASGGEGSTSLTSESKSTHDTDLFPNTAAVSGPSPLQAVTEPTLSILKSDVEHKPRLSPQSVYYQYFQAATTGNKENSAQAKLEGEFKKAEAQQMDAADSESLKFNPRPGKMTLSDILDLENKIELKSDVLDAASWEFPNGVNIRVIRGCWVLYEKPHFEGQAHVLEEGEAVLYRLWDLSGTKAKPDKIRIGSVKRVVKDYLPVVVISSLQDTADSPVYICTEVPSLENLVDKRPRSLTVNSGVWLAYTEPQYNGTVTVLEEGCELPQIQDCGIKSMRALKMGGLKVQLPSDPKIIIYEKPCFQGRSGEITEHVCNIGTLLRDEDKGNNLNIGSMQVLGGIWVGYEQERYKGQQYLLEEGDYEDWHAWGGYGSTLQSVRYLQANFLEASVTLYDSEAEEGKQVDLFNQAIPDLELAGYNPKTQCIHVKSGMWVAYQQKHYCGEQYILEKGRYKTYMDWGGSNNTIMSIRPVLLEPLGRNEVKHLIKAYKSCNFQGESVDFSQEVCDFPSFMPRSFKVLRGCWLLQYQADSCDNLCVLEEGHFPDLASCGIPVAEITYIQPIDYVFAEPSVSLFALDSCEGRELHFEEAVTSVLSKDLHFYTQSVWIRRGLWIAFEGANFLGRQMLLESQKIEKWSQFSGWKAVGSLRPLRQPAVYFMVRNRHRDKYLTVTGKLSDTRATFVSISARNGQSTQIWYFCRGLLKSKANDSCLDIIGGRNLPGSKVSLWSEHGKNRQKWTINKDGTIASYISDDLVLDIKGGNYYDQNYLIVNRVQDSALTQKWDIEIL
ncbi:very large A-kinase anchor protein isoform X2 [Pseudophryne corroboree]|uniref:very large A-kinase anchor protein isoform X2 n=1 Tax=Pseudophryne corroboree TaxID=495146 RepID=UPI00308143B1